MLTHIISPQNLQVVLIETTFNCPKGGGKIIPLEVTLEPNSTATLNLQNTQALNQFNLVQSIFVDNSLSTGTISINFPNSNQTIKVLAGRQGYYNVLSPNPASILFLSDSNTIQAVVILINFPVQSSEWLLEIIGGGSVSNGIPAGGTTGEILAKVSNSDYDVAWVEPSAASQINSDWNATSGIAQILNKPSIPAAQIQSDWNEANATVLDYIKNKPSIPAAQVNSDWNATSGIAQILNKPSIPAAQVNSDWNATSGIAQILNKPSIPVAQIQSDWNETNATVLDYIKNKPSIPAAQVNSDWNATSGIAQILNKPSIPSNLLIPSPLSAISNWIELDGDIGNPSTFIDFNGALFIECPSGNTSLFGSGLVLPLSIAPFTVTIHCIQQLVPANGNLFGLCIYNSSSGKIISWDNLWFSTGLYSTYSGYWNSISSYNSNLYFKGNPAGPLEVYFRLQYDGTNFIMSFSTTGLPGTFLQIYSQSALFIPTHAGFHVANQSTGNTDTVLCDYFSVTYP